MMVGDYNHIIEKGSMYLKCNYLETKSDKKGNNGLNCFFFFFSNSFIEMPLTEAEHAKRYREKH